MDDLDPGLKILITTVVIAILIFPLLAIYITDNTEDFTVTGIVTDMQVERGFFGTTFNVTLTNGSIAFINNDIPLLLTTGQCYTFSLERNPAATILLGYIQINKN